MIQLTTISNVIPKAKDNRDEMEKKSNLLLDEEVIFRRENSNFLD